MVDLDPPTTAQKLIDGGGLVGGLIFTGKAAQILGLDYFGISTTQPDYPCIALTDHFAPKYPTHFFIINPDGSQIDPLGLNIKYHIVNYRLFKAKGDSMPTPSGFSNEQIKSNVEAVIREVSILGFGPDRVWQQDADFRFSEIQKGSINTLASQVDDYFNAPDFLWMLKSVASNMTEDAVQTAVKITTKGLIDPKNCPTVQELSDSDIDKLAISKGYILPKNCPTTGEWDVRYMSLGQRFSWLFKPIIKKG